MQAIDFREPSVDTGIELVSSVQGRRAKAGPLPDPLPEEPPIPFAYLMRLASSISDPSSLSAQQQLTLVAELKAGLEEDGDDASARHDISQLLAMLRDRPDVTWRTRTEVESVLATLEAPTAPADHVGVQSDGADSHAGVGGAHQQSVVTGPQPVFGGGAPPGYPPAGPPPGYQPGPPMGPPPGYGLGNVGSAGTPKRSSATTKYLIAGGGLAAAVILAVAVVVIVNVTDNDSEAAPPPPPPTIAPAELNSLLLTGGEVDAIMGTQDIEAGKVYTALAEPVNISDPACAGAHNNGQETVYAGSGYSSIADQSLFIDEPEHVWVRQTAVAFPSPELANGVLETSTPEWEACADTTVTVTESDGSQYTWTFDDVNKQESQIGQVETQEGMGGYACQHVMRVVSNVIVEAQACSDRITDEAERIADEMAAKAIA